MALACAGIPPDVGGGCTMRVLSVLLSWWELLPLHPKALTSTPVELSHWRHRRPWCSTSLSGGHAARAGLRLKSDDRGHLAHPGLWFGCLSS